MRLAVGDRLGHYVVESLLGAGGMGEVYRAHDPRLDRRLALKVLRVDAVDPETRRRFLQEARAASALNHPAIVTVLDIGNQDDVDFIAMELVEGTSLDRLLHAGALAPARALSVAEQIADALSRAHVKGIVHRDLKPANVMVGPGDRIKLLDFGVAKVIDAARSTAISTLASAPVTIEGTILGTVAYMSPEQAEGHAVDERSDIFSLGIVLFEMIAGYSPFKRKSAASTLAAILREPIGSVREAGSALPEEIDRLIERCVRKDPGRRFQTMADLRVSLIDARESLSSPVGVTSVPLTPRRPWSRVHLGLAAFGGAAVALLAAFAIGSWLSPKAESTDRPTLRRMTTDGGFTVDPAMSPDGTLLAFASDRGGEGGANIWVQQVAGGLPIQVTSLEGDEREPTFSADGARVVFRSEVDGGLYVVSALGGQDPRLLAPDGRRPRISPDGRSVAYWTGSIVGFVSAPGAYRTYLMPLEGGQPREIENFTGVRYPAWVGDQSLLVLGSTASPATEDTYDWWLVPLDGGPPVRTHAYPTLSAAGAAMAAGNVGPGSWRDGLVTFSDGGVWSLPVSPDGRHLGSPRRLTFGPARDIQPVTGGDALAFASLSSATNIWALPLDANRGEVTGVPRPLTTGTGSKMRATPAADGRAIAYNHFGSTEGALPYVLVLDLQTQRVTDTGVRGSNYGSALSPDGANLAYEADGGVSVSPVRGGASRRVCESCVVGDWTHDGEAIAVVMSSRGAGRLASVDVASGESRELVEAGDLPLNRPFFSPGDHLLAFRIFVTNAFSVRIAPVGDVPTPQESWIAVGDPERDLRPAGWSPDGSLLYLLSGRDGYRCLYAQRVDPVTGAPRDEAFAVWHSHENRWLTGRETVLSTGPSSAVAPGFFVFDRSAVTSDIWLMTGIGPR